MRITFVARTLCALWVLLAAAFVSGQSPDEKPLSELKPELFVNLVEGIDKVVSAPAKGAYFTYTGESAESFWTRAEIKSPQHSEWTTAKVPADIKGQRVTFVIPWGAGGEGGKIQGIPFLISVNGKPVITVHSSVTGSVLWSSSGDAHALFALIRKDGFDDPFGLLLLSLPPGNVTSGEAATIRVEGKPAPDREGSFVMVAQTMGNVEFVEKAGGVAKLLKTEAATPLDVLALDQAFPEGEVSKRIGSLVEATGRRGDSVCLTGNAPGADAARNQRVEGRYTYCDGRTDCFAFPQYSPFVPDGRDTNFDEFPNRVGGWVKFNEGKITDGRPGTRIGWPLYLETIVGKDIVFDLGDEYLIDEIEAHATDNHTRNIEVLLKSEGEPRWTTVQTITDRSVSRAKHYPKLTSPQKLPVGGMAARYVRLNAVWEAQQCGFSEVQIWGRPFGGEKAAKRPVAQARGEVAVAEPKELPIALPEHPLLPLPQEMKSGEGSFLLTNGTNLIVVKGASPRTARTAEILAADLKEELNISAKQSVVEPGQIPPKSIVIHPITDYPVSHLEKQVKDLKPQGYAMTITPERIDIYGRDEQGVFYATQTLMLLMRPKSATEFKVPVSTIYDWPDRPIRLFAAGAVKVTPGFLKGIARFKISYFHVYNPSLNASAIENNKNAEDRFVQFIPLCGFDTAWSPNPQQWTERNPGEKYEQLNPGRINPCPSTPEMWKHYFSTLDEAAKLHGEYINVNMDEMYVPEAGSRWNVCEKCRARKMSGQELMADTIEKIHTYIRSKGKKMMIIDSPFYISGISNPDDKENDWRKAAEILGDKGVSKGTLVYIWHGVPLAERLNKAGFSVIWWNAGVPTPAEPLPPVYLGNFLNVGDAAFRPTTLLAMAQALWSPRHAAGGTEVSDALVEHFMPTFNQLWNGQGSPTRRPGAEFFAIDLKSVANCTFTDEKPGDGKGWGDLGPNYDLRALKPGKREFGGVPFEVINDQGGKTNSCVTVHNRFWYNRELPERVEIPVGRIAGSISFLHTLDSDVGQAYWYIRELAGQYFIIYENGKFETMDLRNAINICKFDGLTQWWDYAPRGKSMAEATLVWRGQLGTGNEANLYKAEWINPHPKEKIARIILASPKRATNANPILIAATGVAPTSADEMNPPKSAYTFGARPVEVLYEKNEPMGKKIDLTKGKTDGDSIWRTDDGIVLEFSPQIKNEKALDINTPFHRTAECALYDDELGAVPYANAEVSTKLTLPKVRKLSGLRLCGPYRESIGQAVNRRAPVYNYTVMVSEDGKTFSAAAAREIHIPDEEGPLWLPLDGRPVKEIRIDQTRDPSGQGVKMPASDFGLNLIELYEAEN